MTTTPTTTTAPKTYTHPEVLVTTQWVDEHRHDTANLRLVESDEDVLLYNTGHLAEAVKIDWVNDLNDPLIRDYLDGERFAQLCRRHGIGPDTTLVFYGDKNNWWACYAFWVFKLFGHPRCLIMDGGRKKWEAEHRPLALPAPQYPARDYPVRPRHDEPIRAFKDQVLYHLRAGKPLVDVRSPREYTGELLHMPEYPQEGALRGGHIPGAVNIPWGMAVSDDGTFKAREELERLYGGAGLRPTDDIIAYCRIGERSSHTWFVLTYLLGYDRVRNYDGSWTEWGNAVGAPIKKGTER